MHAGVFRFIFQDNSKNTGNSILSRLQNVDVLTGEGLVHATDSTELTTHTAGIAVVVLRETVVTDLLCGLRIECTLELCVPVQGLRGALPV